MSAAAEDSPLHPPLRPVRRALCTRSLLSVLVGGQLLALLITATGVFSQLLADRGVNIPTSQSAANYAALALFMLPRLKRWREGRKQRAGEQHQLQRSPMGTSDTWEDGASHAVRASHYPAHERPRNRVESTEYALPSDQSPAGLASDAPPPLLMVSAWKYLFLAACDVEGNFLLVKAYQYTTITSVQLLDCFTIPVVMILSYTCMRTVYNRKHLLGAFICLVGLTLLITSDIISGRNDGGDTSSNDRVLGDVLVLIGCCFYAVSNIGQEYLVKSFDRFEFLGMLGTCGAIISGVQMAILERDNLRQVDFSNPVVCVYLLCFNVCLFLLYYFTPLLLLASSALFMNLSFLTSDFWSILFAVGLFRARLNLLYFAAFGIILLGLLIYNLAGVEGDIGDLLRDLCASRAGREEMEEHEASSMPTTHAHTRPMHAPDGFHAIDQDPMLTTENMQEKDAAEHRHDFRD